MHAHELIFQGLVYVAEQAGKRQLPLLEALGIGAGEAEAIARLTVAELKALAQGDPSLVQIRIDRAALKEGLGRIEAQRQVRQTIEALVRADAPRAMLRALYGMSNWEAGEWRCWLGVVVTIRWRPPDPDPDTRRRAREAWQAHLAGEVSQATGKDFLAVHESTGIPVRTLWQLAAVRWLAKRARIAVPGEAAIQQEGRP